jgi:23S rRNA (pseudouridine1915-N3)-methyltransferase
VIHLVVVGRVRGVFEAPVRSYEERIPHYWRFQVTEVEAGLAGRGKVEPEAVKQAEADRILARIPDGSEVWVVTREGKGMGSAALAEALGERALRSAPPLVLIIGGAFGFDPRIPARATRALSLSPMTLPHELARLLVVEQLYRAGTILRNEPYHKGTDAEGRTVR